MQLYNKCDRSRAIVWVICSVIFCLVISEYSSTIVDVTGQLWLMFVFFGLLFLNHLFKGLYVPWSEHWPSWVLRKKKVDFFKNKHFQQNILNKKKPTQIGLDWFQWDLSRENKLFDMAVFGCLKVDESFIISVWWAFVTWGHIWNAAAQWKQMRIYFTSTWVFFS